MSSSTIKSPVLHADYSRIFQQEYSRSALSPRNKQKYCLTSL
jgi:hypothetical protein